VTWVAEPKYVAGLTSFREQNGASLHCPVSQKVCILPHAVLVVVLAVKHFEAIFLGVAVSPRAGRHQMMNPRSVCRGEAIRQRAVQSRGRAQRWMSGGRTSRGFGGGAGRGFGGGDVDGAV
jgi:uncharacterized membrane protein YgcG